MAAEKHSQIRAGTDRAMRVIAVILIVAVVYFARDILIPAALAVLLTFPLHPLVSRGSRLGLPRAASVAVAVMIVAVIFGGIGLMVGRQFSQLSQQLPQYRWQFQHKIDDFARLTHTITSLDQQIATTQPEWVPKVQVVNGGPGVFEFFSQYALPVLTPLTDVAVVLILLIFFLLHGYEIGERLILLGRTNRTGLTPGAVEESVQRIGGYLRMQGVVNLTYGIAIFVGLRILGVPNAFFWGVMAGVLRFVPLLGPWISAVLPTLLTFAIFPGWSRPIGVIALFVGVELVTNMIFEPWLYARRSGLSSLGVVCAILFWAWIWGPVGMILAVPLTAFIFVVGKYVPELALLRHLFGEAVEIPDWVHLYDRLLYGDQAGARQIVHAWLKTQNLAQTSQTLFMPVLRRLKRDMRYGRIAKDQSAAALGLIKQTIEFLPAGKSTGSPQLLCVGVRGEVDDLAAQLVARAAGSEGVVAHPVSSQALAGEVLEHARQCGVGTLCLVQVSPVSRKRQQHLMKRLSQDLPDVSIVAADLRAANSVKPANGNGQDASAPRVFQDVPALMARLRDARPVGDPQ